MQTKSRQPLTITLIATSLLITLLYLRGEQWLRELLLHLAAAPWARRFVTSLPLARQASRRFVAGETVVDALRATRELNDAGFRVSLDFLGESVHSATEAQAAHDEILHLLDEIDHAQLSANVSVKPTQLGLNIDPDLAYNNVRSLLLRASRYGNWVRLDMEDSSFVQATLDLYRRLRSEENLENVGVVIQSYLYRSAADIEQLCQEGARVRLVKGAYAEPPELAFPAKADTDANFVALMERMLAADALHNGTTVAIASHDEMMINATISYLTNHDLPADAVEFQMLYGIRRDLQKNLLAAGYPVRIYVPYGRAWYPYFTRRLAERPANLWFFLSNLFSK